MKPFTPSSLAFPLPLLDLPAIKSWFSPFHLGKQRQAPLVSWLSCFSLQRWVAPHPQIFFSSVTCSPTSPQMWVEAVAPPCWTVSFSSIDLHPTH